MAIGLLRQHLAPGQMVHGIVTDGGQATNVIPGRAELRYTMRAVDSESLRDLEDKMAGCFLAGAVATGCDSHGDRDRARLCRAGAGPVAGRRSSVARWCGWAATRCQRTSRRTLPLGSTDMGNVTQVMPGIHPIVGIEANGASIHQPAFTAAAAGPSADKAVVEGAIMLARTVVSLAETPAERDRVLELQARRAWRHEHLAVDATELWLDAHYDDLVAWRRHIHAHPELGRQEFATTQFVASHLADAGPQPEGAARRDRADLRLRAGARAADRAAGRHGRAADGRADRVRRTRRWCPTSRTPAVTTRTPRCCWARRWRWRRCPSCRSACG